MFKDLFDDLPILDKTDDLHPPLTFGACEGVRFINLLNEPGLVFSIRSQSDIRS